MSNTLSITSTDAGLSATRHLLGPGRWMVFISAPDYSSSKSVQLHTSPDNSDGSYRAERWGGSENPVAAFTANDRLVVEGSCFLALHLTNPGTGATLTIKKHESTSI